MGAAIGVADAAVRSDRVARVVSRLLGLVFLPAGLVKFVAYEWEVGNFERFGLAPAPAWVIAAGVIEVVGAASLLGVRGVLVSIPLLAATMAVAIATSGIGAGDVIPSLTLAPLLLAGLLFLAWRLVRARR